jgi:hypothetical protein
MLRISFKLVKLRIKNIRCLKQGASLCKMAGAGFQCFAKLSALIPRIATIRITAWQSALNHTADCQPPLSGLIWTLRAFQAFGIPLSNSDSWLWQSAVWRFSLWQSAWNKPRFEKNTGLNIWAQSLAKEWNPAPAILHRETACLKCRIYLKCDFTSLKLIRRAMFRPKLYTNGLSWHTISWYYTFKLCPGHGASPFWWWGSAICGRSYKLPIRKVGFEGQLK